MSLDLLLDDECGICHLCNNGQTSWIELALTVAERCGLNLKLIKSKPLNQFGFKAKRPAYSVLSSERGIILSPLDNAIDRYLQQLI
jgi:dTDP-4-dehydrorhamnose reductase